MPKIPKYHSISRGFTLVELSVVIIIIVGILSVYAASRYQGGSSFSPYAAQSQAISVIRQTQLARMQSNLADGSTNPQYQLHLSSSCLGSQAACDGDDSFSSKVQVDGQNLAFSITPSTSDIEFDLLGRPFPLVTSGGSVIGTEYTITIRAQGNDAESTQICINSEGFVSGGDC